MSADTLAAQRIPSLDHLPGIHKEQPEAELDQVSRWERQNGTREHLRGKC